RLVITIVIASEAKQSIGPPGKYGLLRRGVYHRARRRRDPLAPRNDGRKSLKRTDRKIAEPQIGVAAFFPDTKQRPVQRLPQQVVALAHGDADALAEIAALDKRPAREGAAFAGIGAADPERQRDRIAENEIDLAAPQRQPQRVVVWIGMQFG